MYAKDVQDGVIEVIVTDAALKNLNLLLDNEYEIYSYKQKRDEPPLYTMRVVGMFSAADNQDLYWYQHINTFSQSVMVDPAAIQQLSGNIPILNIGEQILVASFDYYTFRIQELDQIQAVLKHGEAVSEANTRTTRFISTFSSVIDRYIVREAELKLTLQILIIPILLMLIFYIFMVSQLMVRSETSLISVLESRGAGRTQILTLYALESLFRVVTRWSTFLGAVDGQVIASLRIPELVAAKP